MEEFLVAILCFAVIGIAVKLGRLADDHTAVAELGDLIRRLEQRLATLERQVANLSSPPAAKEPQPISAAPATIPLIAPPIQAAYQPVKVAQADFIVPATIRPTAIPEPPAVAEPAPPPPLPPPVFASEPVSTWKPEPKPAARSISIEERLGQNWLSKIGIVLVVLGVATFLGYKLVTLGPLGKSLTGLATAIILLGGGLFLERKPNYRIFARAGIGGGWALLFFTTFALYHVEAMQVLTSQATDLILMALVASAMVWHSLRYKSQVVTALAFLLAFTTVGISHVTLFSLVAGAILAAALVYIAAREYWFELGLAGLCGVYINHFIWLLRVLPNGGQIGHPFPEFFASAGLLLLYWFIFRLFYVLRIPQDRRQELVASITAILNSAGLLALLKYQSSHPEWAFRALIALGIIEFLLAFLARTRWRTGFLVLSTLASALLLAAIPFRFDGANWTLLWLFEAEALFIAGVRIKETALRRIGLIAAFLAALQVLFFDLPPVFELRQSTIDLTRHPSIAIALFTAALLFWFNSEFIRRRLPTLFEEVFDEAALTITSYLAAISMAGALWLFFPASWTIVAWLIASLAIAFIADRLDSSDLATQADILAVAAVARVIVINLGDTTHWGALTLRTITVSIAAALLYTAAFRKTRSIPLSGVGYIPAAYSWCASTLLAILCWYELQPAVIAISWGILGLILFELGIIFRRSYLRHQAYAVFAATFLRIFVYDLNFNFFGSSPANANHHLYTVNPLIAAYIWIYHRTHTALAESPSDRAAGTLSVWLGTTAATTLLYLEPRAELVAIGWALLALILITGAWLLRRPIFTAQALALLAASAFRALSFNLFIPTNPATAFWSTRAATIGTTCTVMLLCLPMAFAIRRSRLALQTPTDTPTTTQDPWRLVFTHPEQPFFFVPYALIAILIAFELRTGMITLGWIALGLAAFLAALPIGERSYRLAGLGLLLIGLTKIVLIDFWSLSTVDKILTFVITGAVLMLVSFLYSRYQKTILKFL